MSCHVCEKRKPLPRTIFCSGKCEMSYKCCFECEGEFVCEACILFPDADLFEINLFELSDDFIDIYDGVNSPSESSDSFCDIKITVPNHID